MQIRKRNQFIVLFIMSCLIILPLGIHLYIQKNAQQDIPVSLSEHTTTTPTQAEQTTVVEPKQTTVAVTEQPVIKQPVTVTPSYFDDALFIGDSRTVGLCEYGTLQNATYFASIGMSCYKIFDETVNIPGIGDVKLDTLLQQKRFGKVLIMLGINEIGYPTASTLNRYQMLLDAIRSRQPDTLIFIEGNIHVTQSRSDYDKVINNPSIDRFNAETAKLANGINTFYIDVNPCFDDQNGNLREDQSGDSAHLLGKCYAVWCDWLCTQMAT